MGYEFLVFKLDMKMRLEAADIPPNTAALPAFQTRGNLKAQLYPWAEICVLKASLGKNIPCMLW